MTGVMSRIAPDTLVEGGIRKLRWRGTPFPGQVLVFLHGLGDGADVWRPVVAAWPEGPITAIALDFPGHGGSEFLPASAYTIANMAKWLADAMALEGIRNPILIGHSMGGRVALEAAYAGYVQPGHVVIVDVSPDAIEREELDATIERHLEMLATGASNMRSFVQKVGANLPLSDRDVLKDIVPALVAAGSSGEDLGPRLRLDPEIKRLLNGPNEVNGWAALEALGCPGTIIRGAFSSALDAATARKMSQRLRKPAGNLTVPKAGHAIAFEQPQALAQAIANGLRSA